MKASPLALLTHLTRAIRSVLWLFVGLGLGFTGHSQILPTNYSVSRDFSMALNPNGVWSYGWKSNVTGAFNLFLDSEPGLFDNGIAAEWWDLASHQVPAIGHNATSEAGISDGGQGDYPPGTVWFVAGFDGWPQNFGAIRFEAPESGDYLLESAVRCYLDGERSSDVDYHVVVNEAQIFEQFLPPRSAGGFTNALHLGAGDTVDFLVGRGSDGVQYGSGLKIDATLTRQFCPPHKAKATAQLVNGFVVGATITDPGCGYTNAPLVLVLGGSGSGATASAVISNGVVSRIIITDAGIGYATPPRIVIASPPFVPTLDITVSRVKVAQHIVLGRRYQLQSSSNLVDWVAVAAPFTALSESIEDEFDVNATGGFFRIQEVP